MLLQIKKDNNKGFTLIELLIAMSIISMISISFFMITNLSIKQNSKNEKDIKSLNIAQSEIESLRKEIKLSRNDINIYNQTGETLIEIPNDNEIVWEANGTTQNININELGIYKDYIGYDESGNEILQYSRIIDGCEYIVKLNLSREEKLNKYLYKIKVNVKPKNGFSKKETTLNTSILSK